MLGGPRGSSALLYIRLIQFCSGNVCDPVEAKMIGFDKLFKVVLSCSLWHSAHDTLGICCICCTEGLRCGTAVELKGLSLESGRIMRLDEMSRQGL